MPNDSTPISLLTKVCEYCGHSFTTGKARVRFCSRSCKCKALYKPKPRKGQTFNCGTCGKEFYLNPSRVKTGSKRGARYCSRECNNKSLLTNRPLNCAVCGVEFYVSHSQEKLRNRKCCSVKCQQQYLTPLRSGENCPFWRGGVSSEDRLIRYSTCMKEWRKSVFRRDNYTCQHCGAQSRKGNPVHLHAHHIKQFAYYPDLRFEVSNGLTLCEDCHRAVPQRVKRRPLTNRS